MWVISNKTNKLALRILVVTDSMRPHNICYGSCSIPKQLILPPSTVTIRCMRYARLGCLLLGVWLIGVGCSRTATPRVLQVVGSAVPVPQAEPVQGVAPNPGEPSPVGPVLPARVITPVQHAITVLAVPFTPQAPYAVWDETHQEACEEASMLMVAEYYDGNRQPRFDKNYANEKILELVAWEEEHGYPIDVTAAQVVSILKERYGLIARVEPYSAAAVRSAIQAQQPVILPAAGKLLGNPNFRNGGPLYHMLVVKGYEGDEFITNDPGTRKGESYRYQGSVIAGAVHDWNGGDVTNGVQIMVVLGGPLN